MRLTMYTDYTLRVLIYLALKHGSGERSTIPEIAEAYGISRNHLMKIVHDLGQRGIVETLRGRAGGLTLARPPEQVSIGEVVRAAEGDFALVECHVPGKTANCAALPVCNLQRGFRVALEAFMRELDAMTLADAVARPAAMQALRGAVVPIAAAPGTKRATLA